MGVDETQTGGTKREVTVTHNFTTEIDPDRVEEWVEANFPKGVVQVMDVETGDTYYDDI